jgi:hypothetical protein
MKIIYLRWLDSATGEGWQNKPNGKSGLDHIESVGYLIYEDKKEIRIASSFDECKHYLGVLAIPKSVILERRKIK